MEDNLKSVACVADCHNELERIAEILRVQTSQTLINFLSSSFKSLIAIEEWSWTTLANDQSIDEDRYVKFFNDLYLFHQQLIVTHDGIDTEMRMTLLIPSNLQWIDDILHRISSMNDTRLRLVNQRIDTLSYFAHESPEIVYSPTIIHLNNRLSREFLLTDQYKMYLKQLTQLDPSAMIFTEKEKFHLRTCSFSLQVYLWSRSQNFPFTSDELIRFLSEEFRRMILIQSTTIDRWSRDLLSSISRVAGLVTATSWWGGQQAHHMEILCPSNDEEKEKFVLALIRLVSFVPFHQRISSQGYNDETQLIDTVLILLFGIVETQDLSCFIKTQTNFLSTLLAIGPNSSYDRIRLCVYGFLAEILSNEQIKELKIADHISSFFFDILELTWKQPTKKWKKIPLDYLLKGLKNLSSNDAIQTSMAKGKKMPLLMEIAEHHPLVFEIIWAFSFNETIASQLRSFMTKFVQLEQETTDENLRKNINGILWNLHSHSLDQIDNQTDQQFDVMMSYSHKQKEICHQLYHGLIERGYRVWIDFDQMRGNMMDSMAQAIEQSRTILICMSEQYQRSNYCRAEAQYAFQRQLRLIPILVQNHYKPDGWLSFLITSLLYIDFTKYQYSQAFEMLLKELNPTETIGSSHLSLPLILPENVREWEKVHVQRWLIENELPQMAKILVDMDGPGLIYFSEYFLKSESEQVLSSLQRDSRHRTNADISLVELSTFRRLIEKENFTRFFSKGATKSSTCCNVL